MTLKSSKSPSEMTDAHIKFRPNQAVPWPRVLCRDSKSRDRTTRVSTSNEQAHYMFWTSSPRPLHCTHINTMSLITGLGCLRTLATSVRASAAFSQAAGSTNGDPGPQAARFRKSQRKAMREGRGTKVLGGLDDLDRVFNGTPTPREPQRERSEFRGRSSSAQKRSMD